MHVDPLRPSPDPGHGRSRRPRYVARVPLRRRTGATGGRAPAAPLDCWHVWLADGLVAPAPEPDGFAAHFARAAALAEARVAAYRAHEHAAGGARWDVLA